jgi:hypothetical protein
MFLDRDGGELTELRGPPVRPMRFSKNHHLAGRGFDRSHGNQTRPFLGEVAAEYSSDVKQRMTAADQSDVMRAVTDHIAFRTQDGVFERYRVQNPVVFF